MRKFVSTYVILLIFLLLLAYVYFFERGEVITPEAASRVIYRMEAGDIKEVRLFKGEDTIRLVRGEEGKGWVIKEPGEFVADQDVVNNLVNTLADLVAERVVDEKGENLKEYGLDSPAFRVEVVTAKGDVRLLLVGDKTPTGDNYYIKKGDSPSVYTLQSYQVGAFQKDLTGLRDKRVLVFDRKNVTQIEVSKGGSVLRLVKNTDGLWELKEPLQDLADEYEVNSILDDLENLRVDEFVSDDPDELAPYGLDSPRAVVRVITGMGGEESQAEVLVGSEIEASRFYVKRGTGRSVYEVFDNSFKPLTTSASDLVKKKLADFYSSDIASFAYEGEGIEVTLENRENKWYHGEKELKDDDIYDILYDVAYLRFSDVAGSAKEGERDAFGLENPSIKMIVKTDDGREFRYSVGKKIGDEYYITVTGRPNVYRISASDLEGIRKGLEECLRKLEATEGTEK